MQNELKNFTSNYDRINIYSFSSDNSFSFYSFVTSFSDQITPSWSSTEVYSRMDSLSTYKNTKRKISIAFDVPSDSLQIAKENLIQVNNFMDSLYPLIEEDAGAVGTGIINGPPIFAINFANLIVNEQDNGDRGSALLGIIQNLDFKPELESGFYFENDNIYPKLFKLNFTFDVVHYVRPETDVTGRYIKYGDAKITITSSEQPTPVAVAKPAATVTISATTEAFVNIPSKGSKKKSKK